MRKSILLIPVILGITYGNSTSKPALNSKANTLKTHKTRQKNEFSIEDESGLVKNHIIRVSTSDNSKRNFKTMNSDPTSDLKKLSELNAQFIQNFINEDTVAHNKIIHKDFVCIGGNGEIVERDEYMKGWAHEYSDGKFTSFSISDEKIRIFGNMALVRSISNYKRVVDGIESEGRSIYTDTYIKEDGRWWCVQVQITLLRNN